MTTKTISFGQGKGSIRHNNREFFCGNVDTKRTCDNIIYHRQPLSEAYEQCFGAALQRYNAKQKRPDRQIKTSYYESLFNTQPCGTVVTSANKQKSFYEDLVQIGTMHDSGVGTADRELVTKCLDEYMRGFSQRNPNFYVFNSVLHLDEQTPHLHIDYIPIGHYSRGMDTQNGLAQALKEMGYGTGKDAINRWRIAERKILENICNAYGINISEPEKSRGTVTVEEYKRQQHEAEKMVKSLEETRKMLEHYQKSLSELESRYNTEKSYHEKAFEEHCALKDEIERNRAELAELQIKLIQAKKESSTLIPRYNELLLKYKKTQIRADELEKTVKTLEYRKSDKLVAVNTVICFGELPYFSISFSKISIQYSFSIAVISNS